MRVVVRVLNWVGKWCSVLHWSRFYFFNPPDENNAEEMAVYNRRLP